MATVNPIKALNRDLNIALVRQRYNAAGGAERFVSRAIDALRADGATVTLLTRRWEPKPGLTALIVDPFYIGNVWRDWSFARGVRRALATHSFDLVQSHERIAGCDVYRAGDGLHRAWLARRAARLGPWGKLALALNPYHHYVRAAETALFTSPQLRAVICVSAMVRDEIRAAFDLPDARLPVIYNGIDLQAWHPRVRDAHRATMRARIGAADDETVLLFVGSGFARKGVATLLEALALARSRCRAVIVGRDKHAARYARQAARLGIADRVLFAGVADDVRPWYGAADAVVLPTLYEPFGNVNLEAMACGLPVLTTDACGAAELITEGDNGFVRAVGDVAGFADAIDRLAAPGRAAAMGVSARAVAEQYSLDAMGERMSSLYRRLLDTPAPSPVSAASPESAS